MPVELGTGLPRVPAGDGHHLRERQMRADLLLEHSRPARAVQGAAGGALGVEQAVGEDAGVCDSGCEQVRPGAGLPREFDVTGESSSLLAREDAPHVEGAHRVQTLRQRRSGETFERGLPVHVEVCRKPAEAFTLLRVCLFDGQP
ncbi:hypothetical protein [Curtobacterium sp. MCBD17_030]|uniref:hypothetical protein n=1 Tax=Curtobacterium sp. MCBD17_030 TaxID=2175649 RepID=UPI0011B663B4|nr:hypothetical protein [Curtobacterium sp. MCBD17_030]